MKPFLALPFAVLLASGCSTWKTIPPNDYPESSSSQMRLSLTNGRVITLHSPKLVRDSLRGLCANGAASKSALFSEATPTDSCVVAVRDVKTAELKKANPGGTMLLLGIPILLVVLALFSLSGQD